MSGWSRRFGVRGVAWRQFTRFGALNLPVWIEPLLAAFWALVFLLWGPGRSAVMRNLSAIKPGSPAVANLFRTYRVFWNFAWTITDNLRFQHRRTIPDWEFEGLQHFEQLLAEPAGAIILTAHMGSYDLGAQLFSDVSGRRVHMVRAPETDAQTQAFETAQSRRTGSEGLQVAYNTSAGDLALQLLEAVRGGEIIAIQGDRVTRGVAGLPATLFGKRLQVPAGPFALAMAARVPIYPMFVVRMGRRRYRLATYAPLVVERRSRQRDDDLHAAAAVWIERLQSVLESRWYQWFSFEAYSEDLA